MANQSLVSVPPNVDEPVVLRRFLSRLVEQLDIVLGNRAGPTQQYVDQDQLLKTSEELLRALEEAKIALENALEDRAEEIETDPYELTSLYGVVVGIERL